MVTEGRKMMEISGLIVKFLMKELSGEEEEQLNKWVSESDANQRIFKELCNENGGLYKPEKYDSAQIEMAFQRFASEKSKREKKRRLLPVLLKYAAIFLLPVMLAGSIWWIYSGQSSETVEVAETSAPYFGNKPMLTLADGKEVVIDKNNAVLNQIQGLRVANRDSGELIYSGVAVAEKEIQYHTLTTPAQCDYHFILSDGTKVWLNAKSVLKYPVVFGKDERVVYAGGEIYLEVAKDSSRPFYVVTDDLKVEVLGTSFNVNAYKDEDFVAVTLVEGKVAAHTAQDSYRLLPDKQLYFNRQEHTAAIRPVNVHDVIAWKNGRYIFKGQTLKEVAKVLQRWFDVSIVFENDSYSQEIYTGIVYKEESLETFIERLNASSTYDCYLENNIVYIR